MIRVFKNAEESNFFDAIGTRERLVGEVGGGSGCETLKFGEGELEPISECDKFPKFDKLIRSLS